MIVRKRIFGVSVVFLIDEFTGYKFRKGVVYVAIGTTPTKAIKQKVLLHEKPVYSFWYISKNMLDQFISHMTRILGGAKSMGLIQKGEING